nr:MAG TPA: hypothetical protein [Caudoviricetes sp.]
MIFYVFVYCQYLIFAKYIYRWMLFDIPNALNPHFLKFEHFI